MSNDAALVVCKIGLWPKKLYHREHRGHKESESNEQSGAKDAGVFVFRFMKPARIPNRAHVVFCRGEPAARPYVHWLRLFSAV